MKQTEVKALHEEHKHIMGALVVLMAALFIGFFIYPNISHQRGTVPEAPTDLSGDIGDGQIDLSWRAPADGGSAITSYNISYSGSDGKPSTLNTRSNESRYTLTDLSIDDTYAVSVAAVNAIGTGPYSEVVEFSMEGDDKKEIEKAGAPQSLTAVAGDGSVTLTWEAPASDGGAEIQNYLIAYHPVENQNDVRVVYTEGVETSYVIKGLENDAPYNFVVAAINEAGEGQPSEIVSATPAAPEEEGGGDGEEEEDLLISTDPQVTVGNTSAAITWGTSIFASSQVSYGATDDMGNLTERYNTTPMVRGHTVNLTNLRPCTIYAYKVTSYDAQDRSAESTKGEFVTTGCRGDAEVIAYDKKKATADTGATVEAKVSGRGLTLIVPAAVVADREVSVQAIKVAKEEVRSEISIPSGKTWVGDSYVLSALEDTATEVAEFDKPVEVSIDYLNEDIVGIDPDTLRIWHYEDEAGWRELDSCSVVTNGVGGTVTCLTSSFSVFGIFGEEEGEEDNDNDNSGSSSGSSRSSGSYLPHLAQNPSTPTTTPPAVSTPSATPGVPDGASGQFTKDLWEGLQDADVRLLQSFLNMKGFAVSDSGNGAPGKETDFFGPKTKAALIKFQEYYRTSILTPIGLNFGTGFFGPMTREFINSMQ